MHFKKGGYFRVFIESGYFQKSGYSRGVVTFEILRYVMVLSPFMIDMRSKYLSQYLPKLPVNNPRHSNEHNFKIPKTWTKHFQNSFFIRLSRLLEHFLRSYKAS